MCVPTFICFIFSGVWDPAAFAYFPSHWGVIIFCHSACCRILAKRASVWESLSFRCSVPYAGPAAVMSTDGQNYRYTRQLLGLASCSPTTAVALPALLCEIATPLRWQAWANALRLHPDGDFVRYIVEGISQGFRVGFDYSFRSSLRSSSRNMGSAYDHPEVVSAYLEGERAHGRVKGPLPSSSNPRKQFWGYSQTSSAGQVAAHLGLVQPSRQQRE